MKEKLVDMRYWPLTAGKNNDPTAGALSLASLLNTLLGDKLIVIAGGERDYYLWKKIAYVVFEEDGEKFCLCEWILVFKLEFDMRWNDFKKIIPLQPELVMIWLNFNSSNDYSWELSFPPAIHNNNP